MQSSFILLDALRAADDVHDTKVVENLAQIYENVREGVKSVMGGRVLEHEAKTILREGWELGHNEGHKEGRKEGENKG